MMPAKKLSAPAVAAARGAGEAEKTDGAASIRTGRRPFQGKTNARNGKQRAPKWPEPAGQAALDRLTALWGPPRYPFQRRPR